MKSITQHINESINEGSSVKYTNEEVKAAIAYSTGCEIDVITKLSDEAKGYSYQLNGKSNFKTISYNEVNEILDQHLTSIKKQYNIK